MARVVLLLLAMGCVASSTTKWPYDAGTLPVSQFDLNGLFHEANIGGLHAHAWAPKSPGSYPVIAFASAFGLNTPVTLYNALFTRIAAHGAVVVGFHKFNNPDYPQLGADLAAAVDWLAANLTVSLQKEHRLTGVTADVQNRLVVAGHSAGNHAAVQMVVSHGCGLVKGAVLLDPVDGVDPFGIEKIFVIHPPHKVNFSTPALHIETGNDPRPSIGVKSYPACAPTNMSNSRFYDAWRGPIWQVNATKYGHLDVCDDGVSSIGALVCKSDGLDKNPFRNMVAGLVTAFVDGIFAEDASKKTVDLMVLEDAARMAPIEVLIQHKNVPQAVADVKAECRSVA